MNTITVWQTNAAGFLLYAIGANELSMQSGEYNIPYGAYADAPPDARAGHVARRIEGAWAMVEDHRSDTLYVIDGHGTKYQIGSEIEIEGTMLSYDGGGPIPDWLTLDAPVVEHEVEGEIVETPAP